MVGPVPVTPGKTVFFVSPRGTSCAGRNYPRRRARTRAAQPDWCRSPRGPPAKSSSLSRCMDGHFFLGVGPKGFTRRFSGESGPGEGAFCRGGPGPQARSKFWGTARPFLKKDGPQSWFAFDRGHIPKPRLVPLARARKLPQRGPINKGWMEKERDRSFLLSRPTGLSEVLE